MPDKSDANHQKDRRFRTLTQRAVSLRSPPPRARRVILIIAVAAFIIMAMVTIRAYPRDALDEARWPLLVLVVALGPLVTIFLNAEQFRFQASALSQRVATAECLRISVLSTAANLLPIPGSVVVRGHRLVQGHATIGQAAAINAATGLVWVGTTLGVGGAAASPYFAVGLTGLIVGSGLAMTTAGLLWIRKLGPQLTAWSYVWVVCIQVALAATSGARLYLIIIALGNQVSASQALALIVSGALANVAGIVPAGLGVREAIAAGVATLVDLPAAVGFAAAATDRLAGLLVLAFAALFFLRSDRSTNVVQQPDGASVEP